MTAGVAVRLVRPDDDVALTELLVRNREAFAPFDPVRPDFFFTLTAQRQGLADALTVHARGDSHPCLILVDDRPAGRINLNNVVRGAGQYADLGYWVDAELHGRGIATAATAQILAVAFDELGLHRVQAGTLLDNHASRRVLAKNGFTEIGIAPRYLRIAGRWQDHLLHQRLADDPPAQVS